MKTEVLNTSYPNTITSLLILLFVLCLSLAPNAKAQTAISQQATAASLITNTPGRTSVNLNGVWRTIVDPFENGYFDYRLEPDANGYFKNQKPKDKSDRVEYDFDSSPTLNVPGDWNSQDDKLFFYEGTVWYKRSFDFTKQAGKRAFVHFGAANYDAKVYLNGQKLGEHEGGFTPFNFEITDIVRPKDNYLIIKVDNKRRRDAVPTVNTDWWNYGGLTRDVKIIETPATFVQNYHLQLAKNSVDRIAGWVKLNGSSANQNITLRIPEAGINQKIKTVANGYAKFEFAAPRLTLWSPENPKLYEVFIESESDKLRDEIGFRSIEVKGRDILLNGKSIFLRGVSIHEEAPFRAGRAYSTEEARTTLGWAKEMGCNFVRLAHYPHNENMIREADRLGIMVWSEIPVYWTIDFENPQTYANAENQLDENIERDRNRASVVMWSVANETPVIDARLAFLTKLVKRARALDDTRLITAAVERHAQTQTHTASVANANSNLSTQVINDPLGAELDVLGCNEYIGWYDGLPEKAARVEWTMTYDKPLIMSEFGGDALYGNRGDKLTRWTEDYQAYMYEEQVKMLSRIPFLRGAAPWILMDFRSPRRPLPGIQDYFNRKGLVSIRGERKQAFFVMQRWYKDLEQKYNRVAQKH